MKRFQRPSERILKAQATPLVDFFPIPYPAKKSEFEIQAELYGLLKLEGFNVRGEVKAAFRETGCCGNNRLDLVVFSELNLPIVIIECKNHPAEGFELKEGTRQYRRYKLHGVRVFKYSGVNTAALLEAIRNEVEDFVLAWDC